MQPRAWFQCIKGCPGEVPLTDIVYECPACGALLEVTHDLDELRKQSPAYWTRTFDARYKRTTWPYGSGVWGKKEWVAPHVADDNVVSLDEGGTNLFWAERYGAQLGLDDLWVKMCGNSHTGSFKDLGLTVLVSTVKQMISEGAQIKAVACASTGDTSAALGAYCAVAGIPAVVILPRDKISVPQLIQPIANAALVLSVDTDFDGCMEMVKQLAKEPGIYLANSMNSLRVEGQKTVSIETVQQFDWGVPDWVIIPGGNLGNTAALGAGFLMMQELGVIQKLPRIVVAQAERANPLYESFIRGFAPLEPIQARPTLASAIQIGNPVSFDKAVQSLKKFNGLVEQATENELSQAAARADRTGMFTDPHTGVALAVLEKLVARGEIARNERVVVVSTASGLKFPDFKVGYHEGALEGIEDTYANHPVVLPAEYEAVKRAALDGVDAASR